MIRLNESGDEMNQSTHFMKLKQINVDMIKDVLKQSEYSTKSSISKETGLSVATCGNILSELLVTGEAIEVALEASTGGRPARRFVYNENFASVAAMYFRKEGCVESIVTVVSNMLGDMLYQHSQEKTVVNKEELYEVQLNQAQNLDKNHDENPDKKQNQKINDETEGFSIKDIESNIDAIIDKFPNLKVLALGIPGVVHNGAIGYSHFDALAYFPIEEKLMEKYDILIIAENDMNSTALGFYESYIKKTPESLAYIYYPKDGISGAGIIVNGQIVKGHTHFAGEVSFLPLPLDHKSQVKVQKNSLEFSKYISQVISSINGIINPKKIVLSGFYFEAPLTDMIKETLVNWIPHEHCPELIFERDIHKNYVRGLTHMALDQFKCNIQIVEK